MGVLSNSLGDRRESPVESNVLCVRVVTEESRSYRGQRKRWRWRGLGFTPGTPGGVGQEV